MARPAQNGLTDNELSVMKILWKESPLSVAEIVAHIKKRPPPAYTSVLTLVQAMERKGYIKYSKVGKAYLYVPVLNQQKYEREELKRTAHRIYGGNPLALAINLIKN